MKLSTVASLVVALALTTTEVAAQNTPPLPIERAASLPEPALNALLPRNWAFLRVGTWNTNLRPWFANESKVIKTIAKTNLDVLALQGVWSTEAKDAILADRGVKAKYKYAYWVPPSQQNAECSPLVPLFDQTAFLNCYVENGIDPTTIVQPAEKPPSACNTFELSLALLSQPCLECLVNTAEGLPPDDPFAAIPICAAGNGAKYASGGLAGQLILSKKPIQNVEEVSYPTYLERRTIVYATINNVRIAFSHYPKNYLEEIDPILAPLQDGALQDDYAEDTFSKQPKLAMGTFNSGSDYQPEGAQLLRQAGYKPLYNKPTYCPAKTHASFPACLDARLPAPASIDDVYTRQNDAFCLAQTFAEDPVSDHIGVSAFCLVKTK